MDSLLGRQPIASIEEMWEREDGAHYRSRLLAGVSELVVSGLYGSSVSFRARRFERVQRLGGAATTATGSRNGRSPKPTFYEFSFLTFPQYEGATAPREGGEVMFRLRKRNANGPRFGASLRPARIVALGHLTNGLHRNLEELDGRSPLGSPRIHGVQCLVTAPHRVLALEESDT
jgi:hypothetical protein